MVKNTIDLFRNGIEKERLVSYKVTTEVNPYFIGSGDWNLFAFKT